MTPDEVIYSITNKITGRVYIGQTKTPAERWYHHLYKLRRGNSNHRLLQLEFNEYGKSVYEFKVINSANVDSEAIWINKVDPSKTLNVQKRIGVASRAYERIKNLRVSFYEKVI